MPKYVPQLHKVGDLTKTIEYLRKHDLIDDHSLMGMMVQSEIPADLKNTIIQLALMNVPGFDDHFPIVLIDKEDGKPFKKKPFSAYNNVKQLILLAALNSGSSLSTVKSIAATLDYVSGLEEKNGKPFWAFKTKLIQTTYDQMAKEYSSHTIATKIGLLIKADDMLRKLVDSRPDTTIEIPSTRYWYNSAHPVERTQTQKQKTKAGSGSCYLYSTELVARMMKLSEPQDAVTVLLVYKGVKIARENSSELGCIKVSDFSGNVLTIDGQHPRKITFSDEEMEFIRKLTFGQRDDAYLLRPANSSRKIKGVPLKRYALVQRLKRAGKAAGKEIKYLTLRKSGQAAYARECLRQMNAGEDPSKEQLANVFIACQERMGIVNQGQLTLESLNQVPYQERFRVFQKSLALINE